MPIADNMDEAKAQVLPFPLVPATWRTRRSRCSGCPSAASARSMRPSPNAMVEGPRRSRREREAAMREVMAHRVERRTCVMPPGWLGASAQQADEGREALAQILPVDDGVDHPVLEQELAALEALRKLLADGLLDHAGAGKADERLGLGDDHV